MINSKYLLLVLSIIFWSSQSHGQVIKGSVKNLKSQPISNVNVYFPNSLVGTSTDSLGSFIISRTNKGETSLQFSHISYKSNSYRFTSKEFKKDTIHISINMNFETTNLKEVVITSNLTNDFNRDITLKALENMCNNLKTNDVLIYELTHYVKNNTGYTNYFRGFLKTQGIGYKIENDKNKYHLFLLKNFSPKLIIKKEQITNKSKNCGAFCPIINNKQGIQAFVPVTFNWFGLPMAIMERVNSKNYMFNSINDDSDSSYHIKIIPKKKRKEHQITLIIDKSTLDFTNIYFSVDETLNKYWENKITSVIRKGLLPTMLRQKKRVWNIKCDFERDENKLDLKEITIEHALTYDKKYIDGKNLKKIQFAKWSLKKYVKEKINNGIIIKSYKDLYFEE